jgi:hypothetical protein
MPQEEDGTDIERRRLQREIDRQVRLWMDSLAAAMLTRVQCKAQVIADLQAQNERMQKRLERRGLADRDAA